MALDSNDTITSENDRLLINNFYNVDEKDNNIPANVKLSVLLLDPPILDYDYKIINPVVDYEGWVKSKTELLLNIRDDYSQSGDELSINGKTFTIDEITVNPSTNERTATLLGNTLELDENTPVKYKITTIDNHLLADPFQQQPCY